MAVNNVYVEEVSAVELESEESSEEVIVQCHNISYLAQYKPYMMSLLVNGKVLPLEIDTGSTISCISYECYLKMFKDCKLLDSDLLLRYYTGEKVKVMGKVVASVNYKGMIKQLNLFVLNNARTSLIGREWLEELGIFVPGLLYNSVCSHQKFNLPAFSSRYCKVFDDGLGCFTGDPVTLQIREGARPVFMRARPLAYALREPVERTLDQLVSDGIITPVETSDWATPIVPVVKSDGSIRLCGDYKITLNKCLEVDRYPVPRIEDLLAKLNGGDRFSKIDLSQAYAQFPLDDTKKYTTINTHKGLFQYNRLIYGLASSPGIFQRKLEQMFADLPTVGVYLDDVIITAKNDEEHIRILNQVFERLQRFGLKVKKEKCAFFAESVEYLGYVISRRGIQTCPDKITAISNIPVPTNTTELRSFIGMIMYYGKFVKNISTILSPMYELLKKNTTFIWKEECQQSFEKIKEVLGSSEVLAHYSPTLPLVLTTDASSLGLGAVIAHQMPDGRERPIAYASRVLNVAERGYSQIEKEALSIIYGVKKFHQYLYGRKFLLRTDHKPLVSIFGSKNGVPTMAASRLQRWAIILSGYVFDIEYVTSDSNGADALSRLPSGREKKVKPERTYLNFVQEFLPVTSEDIKRATDKDPVVQKVKMYVKSGWPAHCGDDRLKPFFGRSNEMYLEEGCVLWGYRVVIPESLRKKIMTELHIGHVGVVKMKSLARSYVWWPGIDGEIESACRECAACAAEGSAPPHAPPQPWPYTTEPWTRLHIDLLGPLEGQTFLIMVDSSTKWIEAFRMTRTTASAVISVLRETFARFGIPREVVSDNGTQFVSQELAHFFKQNGINHILTPTYHPSSNGAAENAVKLCKKAIKKAKRENVDLDASLQAYLLAYRNAVHSTTGETPATLLQRRSLRCRLDLVRGGQAREERVRSAQQRQTAAAGGQQRAVAPGDLVWVREHANPHRWVRATIREGVGSRNYVVEKEDGTRTRKHIDQIKLIKQSLVWPDSDGDSGDESSEPRREARNSPRSRTHRSPLPAPRTSPSGAAGPSGTVSPARTANPSGSPVRAQPQLPVSRFGRMIKPVKRLITEMD